MAAATSQQAVAPPANQRRRGAAARSDSLLPASAGVALADILANGVAIVIIMIVVTSMARYQQEQDKLQRTEDVSVLLSRELATSVVMNALPTSPPARLHDYVASPLDRNPQPSTMPILELHNDHVRDYYTGATYSREELLQPENALDAYLASLTPAQLIATRVDIYGIRQFYIAMSIFKAHGLQPRHWHFLSGQPGGGAGPGAPLAADPARIASLLQQPGQEEAPSLGYEDALGGGTTMPASMLNNLASPGALPADVALASAGLGTPAYPQDGALGRLARRSRSDAGRASGAPPSAQDGPDAPGAAGRRFRAAVPVAPSIALLADIPLDMAAVLRALFAFMTAEQTAADANLPSRLPAFDFQHHVLALVPTLPPAEEAEAHLVRSLKFLVDRPRAPEDPALQLRHEPEPALRGQAIAVFPNEPLHEALWLLGPDQGEGAEVATAAVSLQLGSHAAIHQGRRLPLAKDAILILPPAASEEAAARWRVVTLVNPERNDFVLGFVFAAVDEAGRLLLPVDENAIEIGGLRIESRYPPAVLRDEFRQLLFYGPLALLLAAGIVFGWWHRRRPAAAASPA